MSTATTARHVRPGLLARLLGREDRRTAPMARKPGGERQGGPLFASASGHSIYPSDVCAACLDGRCAACSALSAPGEPCWCTHPGTAPVAGDRQQQDSGQEPERDASQPGLFAHPYPPSWEAPSPGLLLDLADSLRNLDGAAAPSYREVRASIETVPFRVAPEQETPEPAPVPYTLADDLTDLPMFREAVARRTRCHAAECLCGQDIAGDTWGGRMVGAGTHLLGGAA